MIPIKDNIPTDRFPLVTVSLIVLNVVGYLVAVAHAGSIVSGPAPSELRSYGLVAAAPTVGSLFSAMLLSPSLVQLVGNMLFLWLFGSNVEDSMGPLRFLAFYVAGGLVAGGLVLAIAPGAGTPEAGAAGAVAGVIGGYALLYPRARILALVLIVFFFGVVEVPALVLVCLWLAMQAAFGNGVEVFLADLGALAFGVVAVRLVATRRKATPPTAAAYR